MRASGMNTERGLYEGGDEVLLMPSSAGWGDDVDAGVAQAAGSTMAGAGSDTGQAAASMALEPMPLVGADGQPLACVAEHASFERASRAARDLAQRHQDTVVVQRVDDVWRVLCDAQVALREFDAYLADVSAMMHALDVADADWLADEVEPLDVGLGEDWDGLGLDQQADDICDLAEAR